MAMLRSRRLEGLLGCPLDSVTSASVHALVEGGVAEAFDLDFKSKHYGRSDSEKRDLAGDVAALANTAGGLIVIGVEEDAHARASGAPGVEVTDAELARIRQVVAAGVTPLPVFDALAVHEDDDTGFVLIAVPKSVLAPHAVLVNDALRFPMRNGATTRYLSEPEVAAAYRTRFFTAMERASRLDSVEAVLLADLDLSESPWIVVTLVPEIPGEFTIDETSFAEFDAAARSAVLVPLDGGHKMHRTGVGPHRLRADDTMYADDRAPWSCALDLHTDGSVVLAQRAHDIGNSMRPKDPALQTLSDESTAAVILSGLQLLARQSSERAHTSGMAEVRVTVHPSRAAARTGIGHLRGGFPHLLGQPVQAGVRASWHASIDDLANDGRALVTAAARLHRELGHCFGAPELKQLTTTGELSWPYWNHDRRPYVGPWAEVNGISIDGRPQ